MRRDQEARGRRAQVLSSAAKLNETARAHQRASGETLWLRAAFTQAARV